MVCKILVEDVLSKLSSWEKTDEKRDAITKEFKIFRFQKRFWLHDLYCFKGRRNSASPRVV